MPYDFRDGTKSPESFTFGGWQADDPRGEVRFRYRFDNGMEFSENVDFGKPLPSGALRPGFEAALDALGIAAGISYYKAFAPRKMALASHALTPSQRAFFQTLYIDGLGEFAFRNRVGIAERINFPPATAPERPAASVALPRRSAVLIGGGKDSLVSIETLRASGEPVVLFAVNPKKPMLACAKASGLPFISVRRDIDPKLFALNDAGALNGHIPITAIVSLAAVAAAFVHGYDAVILSNERSANEGNLVHEGRDINHQFSKTASFEKLLQDYVTAHIAPNLEYFSLLRPLSELHIARTMAKTDRYDEHFTSCNRAFQIRKAAPAQRWCRDCPKCRFTFLVLATAISPERAARIFGGNILDDETQLPGFSELVGLCGHKPWECVGEIAESGAALLHLAADPNWSSTVVVRELAPRLRERMHNQNEIWNGLLTPAPDHLMPARFKEMLDAYIAER